jgi:5-methylcytosine-specific restriction enzyme subunit McrC
VTGEPIRLTEQQSTATSLTSEDVVFLEERRFDVVAAEGEATDGEQNLYVVNPKQFVGHFFLPSSRVVVITPKIGAATIFRMLAYVYANWRRNAFTELDVFYEKDSLLFEPLVKLFNKLVEQRTRRGLLKDYLRFEENLSVLRGAVSIHQHIQHNVERRPDKLYCSFFENTEDIEDNQIIKSALLRLSKHGNWTPATSHDIRINLHRFGAVGELPHGRVRFQQRHYHRLNEDYRLIHNLCALFLENSSISEEIGGVAFKGFLLDMNALFEKFIEQAFMSVSVKSQFSVKVQNEEALSDSGWPTIKPDVTVSKHGSVACVADAKYKRDCQAPQNSDIYQAIAYSTVLNCKQAFLFYPDTEIAAEQTLPIRNSGGMVVKTKRVKLDCEDCVERAEAAVKEVFDELMPQQIMALA